MRRAGRMTLAGLAMMAFGCQPDPADDLSGTIHGTVQEFDTRVPLSGARVFLLDAELSAASAGPAVTDDQGRYRFDSLSPGAYYIVAWTGGRFALFEAPGAPLRVMSHGDVRHDIEVGKYPFFRDVAPVVRGQVLDAATGEPIAGAFVSIGDSDLPSLFAGITAPWEAITGPAGKFTLTQVPVVTSPTSHVPLGLYPIVATAAGYEPRGSGSLRQGEYVRLPVAAEDTVEVELRLSAAQGSASIRGVVTAGGVPRPGISVAVALVDTAMSAAGGSARSLRPASLVPGITAHTDSEGRYLLRGLSPGAYRVHAAYLPDDGWVAEPSPDGQENSTRVVVAPGSVVECALRVLPAIKVLFPAGGVAVDTGQPRLSWQPLPGADFYRVLFNNGNDFLLSNSRLTTEASQVAPPGFWGDGDWARWAVDAYRGDSLVGRSDGIATFVVRSRVSPRL